MTTTAGLDRRQWMLAAGLAAAGVGAQAGANLGSRPLALPAPADATHAHHLRIAFGSCAKQSKPQPIWAAVRAARPDLFLFLGDNRYADANRDADQKRKGVVEAKNQGEALVHATEKQLSENGDKVEITVPRQGGQ